MTAPRRPGGRLLSALDQVLSGLSNFLTVLLVARSLTAEDFGHFSLTLALVLFTLTLTRGLWGTRVSMTDDAQQARDTASALLGSVVVVGLPLSALIVAISMPFAAADAFWLVLLTALAAPVVIAQDLGRYAAVAVGRPLVACISDGAWLLVVLAGFVLRPTSLLAVVTWLAGAVLALAIAMVALRLRPSLRRGWVALRSRHRTGEGTAISSLSLALASYGVLALASAAVGVVAAGSLRGASSLMAPVNALFAFVPLALLPVLYRRQTARHRTFVLQLAVVLVGTVVVWGGTLLLLPDAVGEVALGESWLGVREVLPFTVGEYVFLAAGAAAVVALQARQRAVELVRLGWLAAALLAAGALGAAVLSDSVLVFAAVQTVAAGLGAVVAWVVVARVVRTPEPTTVPADTSGR